MGCYELGERYEISRIGTSPDQSDAQFKIYPYVVSTIFERRTSSAPSLLEPRS